MSCVGSNFKQIVRIGEGFWNIRGSYRYKGIVNIARLQNGKFLLIDAVPLNDELKDELVRFTDNGNAAPHYGTPRHLRRLTDIQWVGSLQSCEIRSKWSPEIEMRIPAGAEFAEPLPERTNHFSCVFVYHRESKTIHEDDTIMVISDPGFFLRFLGGMKPDSMTFHQSMCNVGLYPTPEAPYQFIDWLTALINDWDFDNVVGAHIGNKIGGAKEQLRAALEAARPQLERLSKKRIGGNLSSSMNGEDAPDYNVNGCECG
ncbi:hypothetical protein PROFUN_07803 [Planoprotostelium fungivorum]|uniref:Metallo-beta-lactamase domain-containing protein n=1 Tax=Planoprotostelium fungivorum TaxID=1890364 RepID=A0A2P6MX56_9EUKA|nr:hypothetical protein PROFUN_07803 [Planoprotostelium fungivorum]